MEELLSRVDGDIEELNTNYSNLNYLLNKNIKSTKDLSQSVTDATGLINYIPNLFLQNNLFLFFRYFRIF